ncbi:GNAT family N-acetyltransferase [Telluribacter humicola]|uniref:GNAT family N-acetyltransferase n=1 Tax=Telluribacter humicola TaxID=1720261 RepID=UPI001A95827D|nr:GNAT family N-acetyltransferase [Telluribacter humicola]
MLQLRPATSNDIPALQGLILDHGANEWNHLPEEEVKAHLAAIDDSSVRGIVAQEAGEVVGIMTYEIGTFYPEFEDSPDIIHGYVAEGVVHRSLTGRGIGVQLMEEVIRVLAGEGIRHIYAKRHEENPFSKRLLEKTGFEVVATFDDPFIRPTGSRRTTVCRYVVK